MEKLSRVGKYELEQYLGGSMARVYRARPAGLGEVCEELQRILETAPPASAQRGEAGHPKVAANALPKLVEKLPAGRRTHTGLMLAACAGVVIVMALLPGARRLGHLI